MALLSIKIIPKSESEIESVYPFEETNLRENHNPNFPSFFLLSFTNLDKVLCSYMASMETRYNIDGVIIEKYAREVEQSAMCYRITIFQK